MKGTHFDQIFLGQSLGLLHLLSVTAKNLSKDQQLEICCPRRSSKIISVLHS